MRTCWLLFRASIFGFVRDNGLQLAAAMAFYAVLSLAPASVLILTAAGQFLGRETAQSALIHQAEDWTGASGGEVLRTIVARAQQPNGPGLPAALSVLMLLVGGTAVFVQLQDAMNAIWNVQHVPGKQVRRFVKRRLLSLAMLVVVGLLMVSSLLFASLVAYAMRSVHVNAADVAPVLRGFNLTVSVVVFALLFAVMFQILPDAKIAWRFVWIGGAVTAVLFVLGREAIAVILSRSTLTSAYGAAGSLVAVLLWVYYSAVIVFLGAEFTQQLAERHGGAEPEDDAERTHPSPSSSSTP